jgi:hypothetical protein
LRIADLLGIDLRSSYWRLRIDWGLICDRRIGDCGFIDAIRLGSAKPRSIRTPQSGKSEINPQSTGDTQSAIPNKSAIRNPQSAMSDQR